MGLRHTALLAGLEVDVGVLLVIAGLAGARGGAALVRITGAMAAGVAAAPTGVESHVAPAKGLWRRVVE